MGGFQLTHQAKFDLKSIATHTQRKWGKAQRESYIKQFDDAFHRIAELPGSGTNCEHIKEGYRKYSVGKHFIYYRAIHSELIEVVRILHKQMDAQPQFGEQ